MIGPSIREYLHPHSDFTQEFTALGEWRKEARRNLAQKLRESLKQHSPAISPDLIEDAIQALNEQKGERGKWHRVIFNCDEFILDLTGEKHQDLAGSYVIKVVFPVK